MRINHSNTVIFTMKTLREWLDDERFNDDERLVIITALRFIRAGHNFMCAVRNEHKGVYTDKFIDFLNYAVTPDVLEYLNCINEAEHEKK